MTVIKVDNISKTYDKGVKALKQINLTVEKGELFGLIGPDGAGKSTLFRILTTLLLPSSGSAEVLGADTVKNYKEIRAEVGYMPGNFSLYTDLTVEENLEVFASLFNTTVSANMNLIHKVYNQLAPFKDRRAGALSGGMKQKLALCCALIHKPKVLFLDEPTTGVDPTSRKEFWEILKDLETEGITILVSTPYMDEASLCDRIALMQDGKVLSIDSPTGIIEQFQERLYAAKSSKMFALLEFIKTQPHVKSCFPFGDNHHLRVDKTFKPGELKEVVKKAGFDDFELKKIKASVEDCFMYLSELDHA
ncbi:MAG: ABC transporter ATP-binding protein [Flavobacteriaceae bacterium]